MTYCAGVTTDLPRKRSEIEERFGKVRKWETTSPFPNRASAEIWRARFISRYACAQAPDSSESKEPGVRWYGFSFEHD